MDHMPLLDCSPRLTRILYQALCLMGAVLVFFYSLYPHMGVFLSDFGAYFMATQVLLTDASRLYDPSLYQQLGATFFDRYQQHPILAYVNPPLLAIMLSPLGLLDYHTALVVWSIANLLLFAASFYALQKLIAALGPEAFSKFVCLMLLLCFYSFQTLLYGQISFMLLILFSYGLWSAIQKRYVSTVICLSVCAAIKPHLFAPAILALMLRKDFHWLTAFATCAAVLILALSVICGWEIWFSYLYYVLGATRGEQDVNASFEYMVNLRGLMVYFTETMHQQILSHGLFALYGTVIAAVCWLSYARLRHWDPASHIAVICMAGWIFSPWLHAHDMLLLFPVMIVWMASKPEWIHSPAGKTVITALLILHLPFVFMPFAWMIKPTAIALSLFACYAAIRWARARNT